jgi:hypothetical protein
MKAGDWAEVQYKPDGAIEAKIVTYRHDGTVTPCSQRVLFVRSVVIGVILTAKKADRWFYYLILIIYSFIFIF